MRITRAFRKNFKTIKFKETRIRENLKKKEKSVAKNKKKVGFWVSKKFFVKKKVVIFSK